MVRTANKWNFLDPRPQSHSDDDLLLLEVTKKRMLAASSPHFEENVDLDFGVGVRKPAKAQRSAATLAGATGNFKRELKLNGLGARFEQIGRAAGTAVPRRLTPRVTPRSSQPIDVPIISPADLSKEEVTRPAISTLAANFAKRSKTADHSNCRGTKGTDKDEKELSKEDKDETANVGELALVKTGSFDAMVAPAAGHGVDPKFMTCQTFRARTSDEQMRLAEQLKAMGKECTPLCSPRRLDRRRQKRAQKRIQPHMKAQAKPTVSLMHPPCLVSGAVYSILAEQYSKRYQKNLTDLYKEQLEKEVNIDLKKNQASRKNCDRYSGGSSTRLVTGKFSTIRPSDNQYGESEKTAEDCSGTTTAIVF